MQPMELQLRKRTSGLMTEGLLLGLWVGEIIGWDFIEAQMQSQ